MWVLEPKQLDHLLLHSQVRYQGAGLDMEQMGFKLVLVWDTGTAGNRFTHYATTLTLVSSISL